jgi:hypothetical protein
MASLIHGCKYDILPYISSIKGMPPVPGLRQENKLDFDLIVK